MGSVLPQRTGESKEVMLEGSGAVPRSTGLSHVGGMHAEGSGRCQVQGWGQFCCVLRTGRSGREIAGALEKAAPSRAVFTPYPCV